MSSLHDVKTRKNAVSTIKKITKAMELVAIAKVKKAKKNFDEVSIYSKRIEEVFNSLDQKIENWNEIINLNPNFPKLYIVITSDLGMCGSYNSNIIKLAKTTIEKDDYLIILGTKGVSILSKHFKKSQILKGFENVGDDPNYDVVESIIEILSPLIYESKVSAINILDTKYINSITYETENKQIFPFSKTKKANKNKEANDESISQEVEFEPNPETVVKKALPLYLGAIIYSSIASSKVSEMSSRRAAMEASSDNAQEIIHELEKQYNKIRQAKITQEITEIVSGAQNE